MGTTDETKVGTTVEAGLPDVTGWIAAYSTHNAGNDTFWTGGAGGAFHKGSHHYEEASTMNQSSGATGDACRCVDFAASKSNSIYGNSTTVQPPALLVYIWQRTA